MADKKISQLTGASTPLAGTEVLPIVQGGSTVKVSVANLTAGRTVDATTVNATTLDATNIEVTNIKAKDGTAAGSIADATGVVTLGSSILTTTDINGGTIDGATIGGSSAAAGTFTTLTTSSTVTLNGGTANGVVYLNASKVATSGSALVFDGSNVGINVTPNAWRSATKVVQINNAAFRAETTASSFVNNAYINSSNTNIYINDGFATSYAQTSGQHLWFTAPSGTAGNSVSFTQAMSLDASGNLAVTGSLSKGSGSFRIDHPLKPETHQLVHSFIEAPQADLIYRGKTTLANGKAIVNIDEVAGMTEGTFVALCREVQCFTTNESDWDAVRGFVNGNKLTIECQNSSSSAVISWLVIGERQDKHMYDTDWTDENGKVIVEPEKITAGSTNNSNTGFEG